MALHSHDHMDHSAYNNCTLHYVFATNTGGCIDTYGAIGLSTKAPNPKL